jgi:hypothetical protein
MIWIREKTFYPRITLILRMGWEEIGITDVSVAGKAAYCFDPGATAPTTANHKNYLNSRIVLSVESV